ncbi:leucine-rich repeat protein kinase family protein [Striga asiatica]|uniref:Leucine-rich repeat protein kinase family protein n=1 Tax=Striga asiatica TaxID=4170 RepID=A0A5A7PSP6_STRAF|nr:leucine-rich repeat protein kinase family protein [Striga asiatica]
MMSVLQLANNSFSGSMPNFGNLRYLRILLVWMNNLSGAESPDQELEFISSLANCRFLEELQISANPLNGILPGSIGNLSTSLKFFLAQDCNVKGIIPSAIGDLSSLQYLLLDRNQLRGLIPSTMGKLRKLQILGLSRNRLEGFIPLDICQLRNMGDFYLHTNLLTGPIPECFGELKSLRKIYMSSNKLNSTIPSNFWNLKDLLFLNLSSNNFSGQLPNEIAGLHAINTLELSHNHFSADIPSSIDGCQSLYILNLSSNKLDGSIPPSLGHIKGLFTLDLSNNNLSGPIPESLESLNLLQHFNVSDNKLEGKIPTAGSFINFTSQYFLHNYALCGDQRFQVPACIGNNTKSSGSKKGDLLIKYILPPFVSIIILTTIILVVLARKRTPKRGPSPTDISPGVIWRRISYIELVRGTNAFNETNLLGIGSFGSVFKGVLNTEFKALILEYMPNGSLEKCRVMCCSTRIAKLFDDGETMVHTKTLATIGYAAPEYGSEGRVSTSADVYGYDILLLEIFTRKKPTDNMFCEDMSLKEWVHEALRDNAATEVVGLDLLTREDEYFHAKEECVSSVFSLAMKE